MSLGGAGVTQYCGVIFHSADAKAAVEVCGWFGSVIAAFDVTSSGPRLHTPAQVWAPLREAVQIPASPFFFFFFCLGAEEEHRRGAEGEAAF